MFFSTREKAGDKAKELGLTVVNYCSDPDKHATIDEEEVK
jgi:hypothetical protein